MDIVRIKLLGSEGYDVTRGVVTKNVYDNIEKSNSLDDVWIKDFNKKIKKIWDFKKDFHDFGIKKGDVIIELNGKEIINIPLSCLEGFTFSDVELIEEEGYGYPVTSDIVLTSIQQLEGLFMDVIFITEEPFDFNKFKFIKKVVHNEKEEIILNDLIYEVYYDGVLLTFEGGSTELRMSKVFFDDEEKISKK
jgi:hypothetical protein